MRSAVRLDKAHRVLDGDDLLGGIVRDFAPELLLEGHDQLDRIEAVGAQIVDKAGILGDLGFVHPEMLDDDLLDPLGDVTHSLGSSMACWRAVPARRGPAARIRGLSHPSVAIADT